MHRLYFPGIFCGRRKHINICVHVQICILVKRVLLGYWLRYLHIWVALSFHVSKTSQFRVFSSSGVLSLTLMFWKICQVLGRILELIYSRITLVAGTCNRIFWTWWHHKVYFSDTFLRGICQCFLEFLFEKWDSMSCTMQ